MKNYIRLEPLENIPKKPKPKRMTEEEKTERIIRLAKELNVKIGGRK